MIDLFVVRYTGDQRGPDIIDALITENAVALERGRNELDATAILQQEVEQTVVFRPNLRLGQLVETVDALQGKVWRGKITGISHKILSGRVETDLRITRPVSEEF